MNVVCLLLSNFPYDTVYFNVILTIYITSNSCCYFIFYQQQDNTVTEEIDLSDNYIEGDGAKFLAQVLKENMFIVNLVSAILFYSKL